MAERRRWSGLILPAVLIVSAEMAFLAGSFGADTLAPPSQIAAAFVHAMRDGSLLLATKDTLAATFGGLAVGGVIGMSLGVLLGLVRPLDQLLHFPIEIVRPVPSVALIPIAMVVAGFGLRMEVAVVAFATIWPVLITSRAAVGEIEPRWIEVARVLRLSTLALITKIILPAALPRMFVGIRLAAGIALIVAVTVEIAANPLGLGYAMMLAQQSLNPALMLACLFWIGLIGVALNAGLSFIQARSFRRVPAGTTQE